MIDILAKLQLSMLVYPKAIHRWACENRGVGSVGHQLITNVLNTVLDI